QRVPGPEEPRRPADRVPHRHLSQIPRRAVVPRGRHLRRARQPRRTGGLSRRRRQGGTADGTRMSYNLADCFDLIAATCGEREALIQAPHRLTWSALERRARNVAAWMAGRGVSRQGKVAIYTYNNPAYMEGVYAAMKAAL